MTEKARKIDWKSLPLNVDNSLLFRMVRMTNYMARCYKEAPIKHHGLSARDWRIMLAIASSQGASAAAISKFTGYDQMSVGRTVSKLVRHKWIRQVQNRSDRRATSLYLADAAWEAYSELAQTISDFEQEMLSTLSAAELRSLERIMAKLTTNMLSYAP